MKILGKNLSVVFELVIILLLMLNINQGMMVKASNAKSTINPTADTYVDAEQPNVNFGSSTVLLVGHYVTSYIHNWDQQAYISFDLKGFSCSSQAQLGVFTVATANITLAIYQVNNPIWSESTITWNNRPSYNRTSIGSTKVENNTYTFFNVTNLVKAYQNGIMGFVIQSVSNSSSNAYITSRESSNQKQIPEIICQSKTTVNGTNVTPGYTILTLFIALPILSKFKHKKI